MDTQIMSGSTIELGYSLHYNTKLSVIIAHLQFEHAAYKYTVYRCAAKIVALQKALFTAYIPYKLVLAVLERHGIRNADVNLMVPVLQLTSLIHDIFFACEQLGHFNNNEAFQLESASAVLSNFFWNVFDPLRRHSISLLEIKITFVLLCRINTSDRLVSDFFNLLCDKKSKCVSKFSFEYMLNIFTRLLEFIGEGSAYGAHNTPMVLKQCFIICPNTLGLTEYQFHRLWTTTQTRFLIYANLIALIKRIEDTEHLIHNNACSSCHCEKIIGIRFKCQTCKNLSLCLKCFATGYTTNKHETGHRTCEVFSEDPPPKKFFHLFSKLCTALFCPTKSTEETRGFCNVNETGNETEMVTIGTNRSSNASTISAATATVANNPLTAKQLLTHNEFTNHLQTLDCTQQFNNAPLAGLSATALNASNASEHLQSIIDRLLLQNIKLENQLKCVQSATNEEISKFLCSHQQFLIDIIKEMRSFTKAPHSLHSFPISSTPNRSTNLQDLDAHGSKLTHSIHGADLNRSYLDANKSDYSINDLSLWFNQRRISVARHSAVRPMSVLAEVSFNEQNALNPIQVPDLRDTEMNNFKLLLHKVKEIVDDSYSDNTELSQATQFLENVLDNIIKSEESRRCNT